MSTGDAASIVDFISAHEKVSVVHFMVSPAGTTVLAGDPEHNHAQVLIAEIAGDAAKSVAVPAKYLSPILSQRGGSQTSIAFVNRAGLGIQFESDSEVEVTYLIAPADESGKSQRLPRLDLLLPMDKMVGGSGNGTERAELLTPEVLRTLAADGITFPGKQPEQRLRHVIPSEVRSKYVNRAALRGHAYVGADIRSIVAQFPGLARV